MIVGLDGPGVLFEYRVAVMLIGPMDREVREARRRGKRVDPARLERLAECERVRRAMVAAQAVVPVPEPEAVEPGSAGIQPDGDLDLSD